MDSNYRVSLPGDKSYLLKVDGDKIWLNDSILETDIALVGKEEWSVLQNNKSYVVKVISFNAKEKTIELSVNQEIFHLKVENQLDLLLDQMGMGHTGSTKIDNVLAPMPGLVLKVLVASGQTIQKGEPLLILEAMKMENIIKAAGESVVKAVLVNNQDAVEKNQLLIEME
jgi:biotin carboxyl carrier protein